jgi:hypothetical protein
MLDRVCQARSNSQLASWKVIRIMQAWWSTAYQSCLQSQIKRALHWPSPAT